MDTVAGRDATSGASRSLPTMNIYDCRHLYLIGLDVSAGGGDVVHLDHCSDVLLRSTTIRGLGTLANDAGTGGFTAGQGTGFECMSAPWLHSEAYDMSFTNNIVYDTEGAGIGVNGGFNILMANNTLYRVGSRSHVIEVGFGSRS